MKPEILIVEDEGLIALDLKRRLERAGYLVSAIADDVPGAMLSIDKRRPDLVLMDIRLRGSEDGVHAADQIRRKFGIPVIFVTAHADPATLKRARITEPFGYIVKPFHSVDFGAQIEIALWKHRMEQRLRESEAWLAATIRNVGDALIATDPQGNISFMNSNAADLTGWSCDDARGRALLEIFQVFDEATELPVVNPIEALYAGEEIATQPRALKLATRGAFGWVVVEASFSANRHEEMLLGIIVVFRDITPRRRAEALDHQLRKMDSLSLLSVGLGRELQENQNQMFHCMRQLPALFEGPVLPVLERLNQILVRQQAVIRQLATLGANDPGQPELLDANAVLTELDPEFRKALGPRRLLRMNLDPGVPRIHVDPQQLRENLSRLIAEIRTTTEEGDSVEIVTAAIDFDASQAGLLLTVRDTGRGIRRYVRERFFDPYFQSRPGHGNPGLSLALLRQFVTVSKGRIEVETTQMRGAIYLLSFPAGSAAVTPSAATASSLKASIC